MDSFGQNVKQSRLIWYGHLELRDEDYVGRNELEMQLLKMRYLDVAMKCLK